MTRIKGMKPLINTLIRAMAEISKVGTLLIFFLVFYAILGINLLNKDLRGRCFVDPSTVENREIFRANSAVYTRLISQQMPFRLSEDICSTLVSDSCVDMALDGLMYKTSCSVYKVCIDGSASLDAAAPEDAGPLYRWCSHDFNENPFSIGGGYFSYDNFLSASLSILQCLTMEGWVDLMYMHGKGYNQVFSFCFHMTWVLLSSFVIMQLALASLARAFMECKEDDAHAIEREALSEQALLETNLRESTLMRSLVHGDTGLDRDYSHVAMRSMSFINEGHRAKQSSSEIVKAKAWPVTFDIPTYFGKLCTMCRVLVLHWSFRYLIQGAILGNTIVVFWEYHDQKTFETSICQRRCDLDASLPANASSRCMGPLFNRTWVADGTGSGMRPKQQAYCFLKEDGACSQHKTRGACINAASALPNGLGCYFFATSSLDGTSSSLPQSSDLGACHAGLYTASAFASDNGRALSLRHVCGDELYHEGADCPAFNFDEKASFDAIADVLTWVFVLEMLIKLLGQGVKGYLKDGHNCFDFLIVAMSMIEFIVNLTGSGGQGLSVLRGARLLRLVKLVRSWKHMRTTIHTLKLSMVSIQPLVIVWFLFMYIAGLLFMQSFGGQFRFVKTDAPRANFDFFYPSDLGPGALLTIFQMISGENWHVVMYNTATYGGWETMRNNAGAHYIPILVLFPLFVVLFGNYIIMNLFISILLEGFGDDEDEVAQKDEENTDVDGQQPKESMPRTRRAFTKLLGRDLFAKVKPSLPATHGEPGKLMISQELPHEHLNERAVELKGGLELAPMVKTHLFGYPVQLHIPKQRALGFLGAENIMRKCLSFTVHHPVFESFIILCIFCSTITLIIDEPDSRIIGSPQNCPASGLDCSKAILPGQIIINCERDVKHADFERVFSSCSLPGAHNCCGVITKNNILGTLDTIFLGIFVAEMVFKLIADGFIFHDYAYLRNRWNWLDFGIVIISLIAASDNEENSPFKALRCMRALRPLRLVKRMPGLRLIVLSFLKSLPEVAQTVMVVLVWFCFFGMIGCNFFKGQTYYCYDPQNQIYFGASYNQGGPLYTTPPPQSGPGSVPTIIECVGAEGGGVGVWHNKHFSFDNVWEAVLTLFEMSTTEGWPEVMASTTDLPTVAGVTPIPNSNPWYALYSVIHIIVGAFILLNLIIGNVIGNYIKIKNEEFALTFLTQEQKEWRATKLLMLEIKPRKRQVEPKHAVRRYCFRLSSSDTFDKAITGIILANIFTMMLQTHDEWYSSGAACWKSGMFWVDCVFTAAFMGECAIKLLGLGPRWYFLNWWNVFDLIIVALSLVLVAIDIITKEYQCHAGPDVSTIANLPWLSAVRVIRLFRVFRLIKRSRGLRQMVRTLLISLPSLAYIFILIMIVMIIFSVLFTTFFFNVNTGQDTYGFMDDNNVHYKTVGNSMLMLFRHTTGPCLPPSALCARAHTRMTVTGRKHPQYDDDVCNPISLEEGSCIQPFLKSIVS
jgi:hypothetical protein